MGVGGEAEQCVCVRTCVCERLHVHTNLLLACLFEMQVICMATTNTLNLVDNNDDTLSIVIVVIV